MTRVVKRSGRRHGRIERLVLGVEPPGTMQLDFRRQVAARPLPYLADVSPIAELHSDSTHGVRASAMRCCHGTSMYAIAVPGLCVCRMIKASAYPAMTTGRMFSMAVASFRLFPVLQLLLRALPKIPTIAALTYLASTNGGGRGIVSSRLSRSTGESILSVLPRAGLLSDAKSAKNYSK